MITNANNTPAIILTNPQMGENIGASARAMLNFGLTDLRIVNPRDGWPNERADATSSGALEQMPPVQVYNTLNEAIADLQYCFATTSRQRDMVKPVYEPDGAMKETHQRVNNGQKIGFVFGAERTGLTNEGLSLCQAILTFPTSPEFFSINLAQSVLLIAYEWNKLIHNETAPALEIGDSFPADMGDVDGFLKRLMGDLDERRFFRDENLKPTTIRNIQNIFTRADITDQELRTLHGVLSALRGNKVQSK